MGKASEIWKEIKPKIGEMLIAVNNIETQAEKAQEEAYAHGYSNAEIKYRVEVKEAYQRGLSDAWEAAKKILQMHDLTVFGLEHDGVFESPLNKGQQMTPQEAIQKLKAYEQEKEEQIQVGDEVIIRYKKAVVTEITDSFVRIMYSDGSGYALFSKNMTKTGRNFSEIAAVLEKMRGEQDG